MVSQFSQGKTQSKMGFGRLSWSGSADLNASLTMSNFSWGPRYPQFLPVPGPTPIKSSTLLLGISCLHIQYVCTCTRIYPIPALCFYPDIPSYVLLPSISLPTMTARLPSYVPRCTQNFPQLSTYTPSPKWLFTSLKPLTSTAIPPWTHLISSEAPHHPVRYSKDLSYIS